MKKLLYRTVLCVLIGGSALTLWTSQTHAEEWMARENWGSTVTPLGHVIPNTLVNPALMAKLSPNDIGLVAWRKSSMVISDGKQVSLEYTLTLKDKSKKDSNVGKDPLVYTQGAHTIIPGLEKQLVGLKAGDSKRIEVSPEEGFGRVDPERKQEIDKNRIPEGARKVGAKLAGQGPGGQPVPVQVVEVKENTVVLDFNHPLAGKKLIFDIKVLKVEDVGEKTLDMPATSEKPAAKPTE